MIDGKLSPSPPQGDSIIHQSINCLSILSIPSIPVPIFRIGRTFHPCYIRNNPPRFPPSAAAPVMAIARKTIAHTPSAAASSWPLPSADSSM